MPKKVTGEKIEWRVHMKTWVGRVRGYPDGSPRGRWLPLGSDDPTVAQARYDRWVATGEPPAEVNTETFRAAAERIVARMPAITVAAAKKRHDRGTRLRTYAYAVLGHLDVGAVETKHVASVLDRMPGLGKLKGTIAYVRNDLRQVFEQLVREGARKENPARGVSLPNAAVEDGRPRQVLTDEEITRFRAKRGFDTELDIACLLCRDVAGHRTSDLLAARWEHIDWGPGTIRVRRPKTDTEGRLVTTRRIKSYELVTHVLDETVLPKLASWWGKQGEPMTGSIFVVNKPCKGGTVKRKDGTTYQRRRSLIGDDKSKKGVSFAPALRRALWAAGIYRPRTDQPGWDPAKPDKQFCSLQTDTEETRAVDFHSMRRAFVTAVKRAGVPLADVLALAGHTSLATSSRYDTARLVAVPTAALPGSQTRVDGAPVNPAAACAKPVTNHAALLKQLDSMRALLSLSESVPEGSISEDTTQNAGRIDDAAE